MEKRLKFEKESCEFHHKMQQKTWHKDKKMLENKIAVSPQFFLHPTLEKRIFSLKTVFK